MPGLRWKLDESLEFVTITLLSDPPVAVRLGVEELEKLLTNLGDFRSAMKPEVTPDHEPRQNVLAVSNPRWMTEPDPLFGRSLLHLRDPRYGWLHYMIPKEEAQKLAGYLHAQASTPSSGQGSGRPQ